MERAPAPGATTPSSSSTSSFMRHFRPRTSESRRNGNGNGTLASPSSEDFSELNRSTSGFARTGLAFPRSFSASSGQLPQSPQSPASPEAATRRPGISRGASSGRPGAAPDSPGAPAMTRSGSANGTNNPFGRMVRRISGAARADAPAAASPTSEARPNGAGSQPAAHDASGSRAASSHAARGVEASGATDAATGSSPAPGTVHRIRLVPHLEATRSLHFEPIERDVAEGEACLVKMGRFTDRAAAAPAAPASEMGMTNSATMADMTLGGPGSSHAGAAGDSGARTGAATSSAGGGGRLDSTRVAFKSKVVSRGHAELWCESGGKFFIRDTKSSSGTFLNHIRLSAPNAESRPFAIKDGDVIQLGVDYQGGTEEVYRCVKMRVELNRAWQRGANQFNVNALRQLRALQGGPPEGSAAKEKAEGAAVPTNLQAMSVTDCCICLFSVTVCQSLFIAPCSHVFHYKCIRPLLQMHHPGFSCPLCRTFADLEADVEQDDEWQEALIREADAADAAKAASTPMAELPDPTASLGVVPESSLAEVTATSSSAAPQATGESAGAAHMSTSAQSGASPLARAAVTRAHGAATSPNANADGVMLAAQNLRRAVGPNPGRGGVDWARPDTAVSTSPGPSHSFSTAFGGSSSRIRALHDEVAPEEIAELEETDAAAAIRRPSAPIDMPQSQPRGADIFTLSAPHGFDESHTPRNEVFLSTLAAPLPGRSSGLRPSSGATDSLPSLGASFASSTLPGGPRRASAASGHSTAEQYDTPAGSPSGRSPSTFEDSERHGETDAAVNGEQLADEAARASAKGKAPAAAASSHDHDGAAADKTHSRGASSPTSPDASAKLERFLKRA